MPRSLAIAAEDGRIDAQLFTPDGAADALPAVLLLTDIGGVRPSYETKAQRLADGGYAVLMPNIYYRDVVGRAVPEGRSFRDPDVMAANRGRARKLTPEAQARDAVALLGAIDQAAECAAGPVGVVGYCLTGGMALRFAALHPDRVAAAAGFHSAQLAAEGDPASPIALAGSIRGRVYLGHADRDEHLPSDQIGRVDAAFAAAGVHFATELFRGAMHGFTNTDASSYDATADALHFKRLFTLLGETLGTR